MPLIGKKPRISYMGNHPPFHPLGNGSKKSRGPGKGAFYNLEVQLAYGTTVQTIARQSRKQKPDTHDMLVTAEEMAIHAASFHYSQ